MLHKGSKNLFRKVVPRVGARRAILSFLILASSFHFAVSSPPEASGDFSPAAAEPTRNQFCFVV
jgi:hypothetical protein